MLPVAQDQQQLTPFRSIVPFEWKPHTAVDCGDDHLLGSSNNPAILEQLQCPICLKILHQPLELPCRALVCTACLVEWFKVFNCSGVKCPCCFHDTPITAPQLKAAPLLIQTLLRDIVLQCQTCRKDIKACDYGTHQCNGESTKADLQTAFRVLRRLASRTPSQPITIPTGGTPLTFMHITKARTPTKTASARTIKRRCMQMQNIREVVSQEESSTLLRRELDYLSTSDQQILLQEAGIVSAIGPGEALAIKAGLGMPWSKLRVLRSPKYMDDFLTSNRWLKASGVSISCEEKMRQIARGLLGENLQGEVAPLSFCLSSGGEAIRGAPLVFMPDLNQKVIQMLDDNHSVGRLTWHSGIIPQAEVWVKLGGDKGGNTTKMNFQIVNVPTPNSIHNTCVFCCFAATDSVANLHSALDRYRGS
eukprot:Em0001g2959a